MPRTRTPKQFKIGDVLYREVENLGFQGGHWAKIAVPAAMTDDDGGRVTAVSRSRGGPWRLWTPEDRLRG